MADARILTMKSVDGTTIWLNPENVESVEYGEGDETSVVTMTSSREHRVKGGAPEVVRHLRGDTD